MTTGSESPQIGSPRAAAARVAPSYLFGTIHVANPRALELPEPVNQALVRDILSLIERQGCTVTRAY